MRLLKKFLNPSDMTSAHSSQVMSSPLSHRDKSKRGDTVFPPHFAGQARTCLGMSLLKYGDCFVTLFLAMTERHQERVKF